MPSQCLCALVILTILSINLFDDIAPKVRLSKYLKYIVLGDPLESVVPKAGQSYLKETIYSLDLASMTAEPRTAESYGTTHPIKQFVDLRSFKGFGFSERHRPSKMSTSGTATDLWTTSSFNSA
jgi:hypothetical protein